MKSTAPTKITFVTGLLLALIILFSGILASTAMDHSNGTRDCLFVSNSGSSGANADNCLNFQTGVLNELSTADLKTEASGLSLILLIILSGGLKFANKRLNLNLIFLRFRSHSKLLFKSRTERFLKQLGYWLKLLQKQTAEPVLSVVFYGT